LLATAPPAGLTPSTLLAAAEVARAHGDGILACDVLERLPKKPTLELAAAAIQLFAEGAPLAGESSDDALLKLYEERLVGAVDVVANATACHLVAGAALRQGKEELLQRLLAASTGPGPVALLKSFSSKQSCQHAFTIFEACPTKTTCLFNALLDVCIECGDSPAAEWAMKEATASGLADVITYNTSIKAHLQHGNHQKARATIESMRSAGFAPNVVTFNELIDETMKSGREGGWALLEEMKACGLRPNQVTCSIFLKNIQRSSRPADIERTLAMTDQMGAEFDEVLLSSLCEALVRAGRGELLAAQLRKHRGAGAKGVRVQGAHTFGSIIRAYGYVKDINGIWDTWNEMRYRRILPTSITFGCMVEALCTTDSPEAGHKLIQEVLGDEEIKPLLNAIIYCSVLKGFSHQKKYDCVWKVHQEMVEEKVQFSITTYNTLIDACARSASMAPFRTSCRR
jgi:pentatricopeptide repeat protein